MMHTKVMAALPRTDAALASIATSTAKTYGPDRAQPRGTGGMIEMTDMAPPSTHRLSAGRKVPHIVGLACSAGGFDALVRILSDLPATFGGCVVVLRHQSPRPADLLASLLTRTSALPVTVALDSQPVSPGVVLVAPPGHHTLVTPDLRIALIDSGDRPPYRPSADLLFTSMALAARSRAIAVVLSGYGNDGATGATAVHRFGGTVIVSDEATSDVFVMPSATLARDDIVNQVLPVESIAAALTAIVDEREPSVEAS